MADPADVAVELGDHLLVAAGAAGRLQLLNRTGAFVWRATAAGMAADEVASLLAEAFGLDSARARDDVHRMLESLRDAPWPQPAPVSINDDVCDSAASLTLSSRCYRLNGRRFRIILRNEAPRTGGLHSAFARLEQKLSGLLDSDQFDVDTCIALLVVCNASGVFSVSAGERCWESRDLAQACEKLYEVVLELAYGAAPWLCFAHAAAAAWRGRGILMPAVSGSGKSTLGAYLASQGWGYLGDDIISIDPVTNDLLPLPTSVGLKSGSIPVLEPSYPCLSGLREYPYGGKRARYLRLARGHADQGRIAATAIVVPRYQLQGAAKLRELGPAEAAAALMEAVVGFTGTLDQEKVQWFADLVNRLPCYSLHFEDLAEAEQLLRALA